MYRLVLSHILPLAQESLARHWLSPALLALTPEGPRRHSWLAGRVLLAQQLDRPNLPPLFLSPTGKPSLPDLDALHFSLSHSGNWLALLLSDQAPVGCDLEVIRPRPGWPALARQMFSPVEQARLTALPADEALTYFWRLWTLREATLKQTGQSVWQMPNLDIDSQALRAGARYLNHFSLMGLSLATCTLALCPLSVTHIPNGDPRCLE